MNVNTSNKWTRALWEPTAGIQTSKPCVALCDLHGKMDFQLVLVDESCLPNRLKLYKGLKPAVESVLADPPAAIVAFVCDAGNAESTCLAVACGSSLLIYRNMKPYYRYNLPQKDILTAEIDLWARLKQGGGQQKEQLMDGLKHLQMEHSIGSLSYQSQQLLSLAGSSPEGQSSPSAQQAALIDFVLAKESRDATATGGIGLQNVQITCMTVIPRNQSQTSAVDVLLLGTERGSIYFVDSQAYTVLHKNAIPAVPVKILSIGHFDLEYRVVVCTREHDVFVLRKNGKGEFSTNSFYIREHPFDVVLCANQLVFATRRRRLIFFSLKCRRQNSMQFDEEIVDIEQFYYEPKQYSGVLVVLANEIHLYIDQLKVDTIRMDRPIDWIRFGRMGREEGVLVIATHGGGLCVKIFRRVATFEENRQALGQRRPAKSGIELPKKSRTFVDQSLRERQNPRQLHQIYQRDWFMVKWHTTKTFAALEGGKGASMELVPGTKESQQLQIHYEVLGFGPRFRLQMRILCTGKLDDKERWMAFVYNGEEYSFANRMIPLPRLVPNRQLSICTQIRCLHPEKQLAEEEVRIVLCKGGWARPIWAATFLMPMSEPEIN